MRQMIIAGLALALAGMTAGQASAELEGFFTNDLANSWKAPAGRAVRSERRQANRPRNSTRNSARRQASLQAEESFDDGSRPQRRGAVRSERALRSLSGGTLTGIASYYWQPQRVASGGWFNPNALTAAHKTLPFGTRVRVTHLGNGRSVVVRINDRGPYIRGRIIDLSKRAAGVIGMQGSGIARVNVQILGR